MYDVGISRHVGLVGTVLALAAFAGCGSSVVSGNQGGAGGEDWTTVSSSSSSSSSSSGAAGMGGAGGSGGSLPACEPGLPAALAVDKMFFGDVDFDGTSNPTNGWKGFGYNIDNRISTKLSTDLCKPKAGGSPSAVYPDGTAGIDNSFGKNILPILLGLASDLSTINNEAIAAGEYTYLFTMENISQESCTTSSALLLGANLGKPPKFDGLDEWPVDASSVLDPSNPNSAKCVFSNTAIDTSYVYAGPPSKFDFILKGSGFTIVLPVRQVRMRFKSISNFDGAGIGQIGGVMNTEEFVQEIAKMAQAFDPSFCDPNSPTLQSILNQIRQASDIMADGTQDPTKECDGISIGLGFTMKRTLLGAVAPPQPPPPDPCGP